MPVAYPKCLKLMSTEDTDVITY